MNVKTRRAPLPALVLSLLVVITLSGCAQRASGTGTAESTVASSASNEGASSGAETPADAVKSFVTQVLRKQYVKACLATAPEGEVPEAERKKTCNSAKAKEALDSLRGMWAKPGVKLPPEAEVEVADVTENGDTAKVLDTAVTLDGRTLRELELIGASGDTESFNFSLDVQKVDDSWHVANWNIDF